MKKSELIKLIKEAIAAHTQNNPAISYTQPVALGQPTMHVGSGIYVPIAPTRASGPSRPATPEEEMFGHLAIILAGGAILAIAAPAIWNKVKSKYNQVLTDMKNKKLGSTVDIASLAKEIENASSQLSPATQKTVQRMFSDAKNAETPKQLGEIIAKIRNHIARYSKPNNT
jgi:hypothetical protein